MDRLSTLERYGVTPSGDVLLSKERTFYDGNAYQGLGHPDATSSIGVTKGNLSCKLVLAFESGDVASIYPSGSGASTALSARGNTLTDTDEYIQAERYQYDSNGMITGAKDPNGNESTFAYDTTYGLFPVTFTDALAIPPSSSAASCSSRSPPSPTPTTTRPSSPTTPRASPSTRPSRASSSRAPGRAIPRPIRPSSTPTTSPPPRSRSS